MKKPIIAITGNQFFDSNDTVSPHLSYCATGFVTAVQEAGGVPLIMPISEPELAKEYVTLADKLIFTGGQNVLPQFYQEEQSIDSDDYLLERDLFELALMKEALLQNKPIFTVCRGTQLFNVLMGGTLYQDIPNHWQTAASATPVHDIGIEKDSLLATIYGEHASINSFHHQAIKKLAPDLIITARSSDDGIIEAIERKDQYPYLGVQWHPELMVEDRTLEKNLFSFVVNHL
ncbi:gamma-glutamyl-gamma-aminobutyrate hydrolase family protein [Streptococcus cameli]